jgi:hypothetical protein
MVHTGRRAGSSLVMRRAAGGKNRNNFFCNYLSRHLDIWHTAFTHCPLTWDSITGLSLIHFLFDDFFDIKGQC